MIHKASGELMSQQRAHAELGELLFPLTSRDGDWLAAIVTRPTLITD